MKAQPNGEQRIEGFKLRNGCENRQQQKPRQVHGPIQFHSCYCNHLHPNFNNLYFIHEQYCRQILPYAGSLMDQPNHIIEIFRLFDQLKSEFQEQHEKARK